MKNSKLVSIILVITIGLAVLLVGKEVMAADSISLDDLTQVNNKTTNTSTGSNSISTISGSNTTKNTTTNTTATNVLKTTNTKAAATTNTTNLPKTGVEDSLPGIILVVALGISAVYAYNKIKYYNNI